MVSRRAALRVGSAVLVAGVAGLGWRAWRQGVFNVGRGPAYDAWNTWAQSAPGSELHLVHAAILAANPHNSQPWAFRVASGRVDLFADPARNIGAIDPFRREMHVGLGCALENLLQAAAATGWKATVALLPEAGDPSPIATIALERGPAVAAPLYAAIPNRHTNRGAYDVAHALPESALNDLAALGTQFNRIAIRWFTTPAARAQLGSHIVEAARAIVADRDQSRDSAAWFRDSWDEIQSRRDGLTIDAQALPEWLRLAAKILPPPGSEQADRVWLEATREVHVGTAPVFGLLVARDASDNAQRLEGGRLWQRMHLWATTQGIAMHPLNQLPERADRERSQGIEAKFGTVLTQLIGDGSWQALMPFRMGYPTKQALASPRRNVADVVLH